MMHANVHQTETLPSMIPPSFHLFAHWLNFKNDKVASGWLK